MKRLIPGLLLAAVLFLAVADHTLLRAGEGAALRPEDVVGRYAAAHFEATRGGDTYDLNCLGGHLQIDVTADHVAGGELLIPDTLGFEPALVNLFGPYELSGETITFRPQAGTFVEGLTWQWLPGGILQARATDGDLSYRIELQRQ